MYVNNARVDISQLLLMPEPVKSSLLQQPGPSALYKATWADCFDYSYGLDDDRHEKQLSMHAPFLPSADQQLLASESLLLQRPAQPKSIESSRMAVEIFLKAYLCIHHGFTEAAARGFSHNLETALHAILSLAPASELQRLRGRFGVFPSVGERYEGKSYAGEQLWEAYSIALYTGASIARSISSRNMRGQFGLVF